MRIRFTSPHPKDVSIQLLQLMQKRNNICKQLHLPFQSGSNKILQTMRRGYTHEGYIQLVKNARIYVPNICISTDIIAGFCGETEQDHLDTISLMKKVYFDKCYMFKYSMRTKTYAYHHLNDSVSESIKLQRLQDIIECDTILRTESIKRFINTEQVVLVEKVSPKVSTIFNQSTLYGRTDGNIPTHFPIIPIPVYDNATTTTRIPVPGEYVRVKIIAAFPSVLHAEPISIITSPI